MDPIWQALADVIRALFTRPENVALMVSIIANVGMAWFIARSRKEDREDRKAFIDTLSKLTEALTELRIAFATAGIRG
jgi:hypothetical protein